MSYDLYLWAKPNPVTAEQASDICQQLAGGNHASTTPTARLLEFAAELVRHYPRLEDLTDLDDSPWNMSPDATDHRVILCMGLSQASKVGPRILELANRYSLVCYDPSTRQVHHPTQTTPEGALRLEASDGSRIFSPTTDEINQQVRRITPANWHAWLEREEGVYVQIGLGPRAGAPEGRYSLEYRDGSADQHYRVFIDNLDEAVTAFHGFASDDAAWKSHTRGLGSDHQPRSAQSGPSPAGASASTARRRRRRRGERLRSADVRCPER